MEDSELLQIVLQQIAELRVEINQRLDRLDDRTRILEIAPGRFFTIITSIIAAIAALTHIIIRAIWR